MHLLAVSTTKQNDVRSDITGKATSASYMRVTVHSLPGFALQTMRLLAAPICTNQHAAVGAANRNETRADITGKFKAQIASIHR